MPAQLSIPPGSSYCPQFDGLRAIAIIGVLIEHFGLTLPTFFRYGPVGVRFFFALSGYFITLSLWKLQSQSITSPGRHGSHLFQFYLKRLLRIGPAFYATLIVGVLLGVVDVRRHFFWLATFQVNHLIAYLGYWPDSISHFWSLAVQEQFYLLWPLLILYLPRRWFLPCMAALILLGPGFRFFCIFSGISMFFRWVTIFGCLDSFAVGALIAYLKRSGEWGKLSQSPVISFVLPFVAFSCFFLGRAFMVLPEGHLGLAFVESFDAVFLAWLLITTASGIKGVCGSVLGWPPLVYLGKISYGIYVYHMFVLNFLSPRFFPWIAEDAHGTSLERLAVLFVLTLALASFSWHYFEKPFINWKNSLSASA